MNKKEIAEIKKQFCAERCAIDRICSCYVDGEKNIRTTMREAFLSLPEEEIFKYFNIFRKVLSGHLGKNLLNLEFPREEEYAGGTMDFLLRLRDSRLSNEYLLDTFYRRVIENYFCPGNYYIILIHGTYDIPGKASDGLRTGSRTGWWRSHCMAFCSRHSMTGRRISMGYCTVPGRRKNFSRISWKACSVVRRSCLQEARRMHSIR